MRQKISQQKIKFVTFDTGRGENENKLKYVPAAK